MKTKHSKSRRFLTFALTVSIMLSLGISVDASGEKIDTYRGLADTDTSSITVGSRFLELIFGKKEKGQTKEDIYLCPGGDAFGVKICGSGVTVSKVIAGLSSEYLHVNDRILSVDKKKITTIEELKEILNASGGKSLSFEIMRSGKKMTVDITPRSSGGEYHLGVILSDGASGIGTITYYDPETLEFGGLGHGICSQDGKEVLKMTRGEVTGVILAGAKRGETAHPGELRGVLTDKKLGEIYSNTECGVFGRLSKDCIDKSTGAIPIALRDEVKEGDACILSTIKSGTKSEYKIKIHDIERNSDGTKSFKITVTDETLIALTGGIVRGMSGSPIIQDGKLVGAVTHVMVANPTEGYGIFIENMLNAAQNQVQPKAA